jgi:hypothetical protein
MISHVNPSSTRSELTLKKCSTFTWDCQSHTFMGSPEQVAANLADLPTDLVERRVYMLMIQGDGRAEARVYERFNLEDTEGTVAAWGGEQVGDLVTLVTDVLVTNRGVHCPGEQVKAALEGERDFDVVGPVVAPKTAAEAFGPAMAAYQNDRFVQATVMVLC